MYEEHQNDVIGTSEKRNRHRWKSKENGLDRKIRKYIVEDLEWKERVRQRLKVMYKQMEKQEKLCFQQGKITKETNTNV